MPSEALQKKRHGLWDKVKALVICICPSVTAFFMFLLGSAASQRLFSDIGQGLLCPSINRTWAIGAEWAQRARSTSKSFYCFSVTKCYLKRPRAVISRMSEWCETLSRTPSEAISPGEAWLNTNCHKPSMMLGKVLKCKSLEKRCTMEKPSKPLPISQGAFYKFHVQKISWQAVTTMNSFVNSGLYSNLLDSHSVTMPALLPRSRQLSS